ncbi:MAG: plastocyanin/azurin family copper-binding protein [Halieaceae bacterium]|jgi:plastocyanin|nr:plastocyanin/azurin family copper-binding protein [Halieaceae bacterium]
MSTLGATLILLPALSTMAYAGHYCAQPKAYGAMPAQPYYGQPAPYYRPYHWQPRHYQPYGYQRPAQPHYGYQPQYRNDASGSKPAEKGADAAKEQQKPMLSEGTKSVSIRGMQFGSGNIEIKVGESVTWTNQDGMPHTVTSDDGSFGSSALNASNAFTHSFDKPGTYSYYCQYHPNMKGVVTVTES